MPWVMLATFLGGCPRRFLGLAGTEIGYLPVSQDDAVLFFQLINARHERVSTVLTSNKGFEEWGGVLGDEVMAAALIDRYCTTATSSTSGATATGCGPIRTCCDPRPRIAAKEPQHQCRTREADWIVLRPLRGLHAIQPAQPGSSAGRQQPQYPLPMCAVFDCY